MVWRAVHTSSSAIPEIQPPHCIDILCPEPITLIPSLHSRAEARECKEIIIFSARPRPVLPGATGADIETIDGFSYVPGPAGVCGCGSGWAAQSF